MRALSRSLRMTLLRNWLAASSSNLKRSRMELEVSIRRAMRSGRSDSAANSRMVCLRLFSMTSKSSFSRLLTKRPRLSVTVKRRLTRVTSSVMVSSASSEGAGAAGPAERRPAILQPLKKKCACSFGVRSCPYSMGPSFQATSSAGTGASTETGLPVEGEVKRMRQA